MCDMTENLTVLWKSATIAECSKFWRTTAYFLSRTVTTRAEEKDFSTHDLILLEEIAIYRANSEALANLSKLKGKLSV